MIKQGMVRRLAVFYILALVLFLFAACKTPEGEPEFPFYPDDILSTSRSFNAQRADNNAWYTITAVKLAETTNCIVYADRIGGVSVDTAKAIANKYETSIHGKVTGVFGDYRSITDGVYDVDGNGKVIFLLLDIKDGYNGSGGYVAGYFDSKHMLTSPLSNRADMLFLDTYPQQPGSEGFYSTIAHELTHLINYAAHGGTPQELWINEGLATASEYLYGGQQAQRISYFNFDPVGTIAYGNNFFVWDGYWEEEYGDVLADYATAYLFFQWLRIHASNGTGIYTDIMKSTARDYLAVTGAAKARIGSGIDLTGSNADNWNKLLSSWMIANIVGAPKESTNKIYGYKGEISTSIGYFPVLEKEKQEWVEFFDPGEGVYSELTGTTLGSGDVTGSGSHVKYLGITPAPNPILVTEAPYTGDFLLTYNANSSNGGYAETGYVLSRQGPELSPGSNAAARSAAGDAQALPQSYPIDRNDLPVVRAAEARGAAGRAAVGYPVTPRLQE